MKSALPTATAAIVSAIVLSACGAQTESDPGTAPPDQEAGMQQARATCHEALLATLEDPGSANLVPEGNWPVERQPDDTLLVRPSGETRNALGETIVATWECVVLPDGARMRLVTLTLVDL